MRKITKLFAGLLASAMVLTMSTAVFASAEEKTSTSAYTDHETVTIQKKYKLTAINKIINSITIGILSKNMYWQGALSLEHFSLQFLQLHCCLNVRAIYFDE